MTGNLAIPETPDAITPRWLTAALRAGNPRSRAAVAGATLSRIGENEGFTGGALFRVGLRYDRYDPRAPATLVAKLSPPDPALRATFAAANQREVGFYTRFARDRPLPVARCHFAAYQPATGASILLLEDLGDFRQVGFVEGCGARDASRVIRALAQVHAQWWERPELAGLGESDILNEFRFSDLWPRYREILPDLLPDVGLPAAFLNLGNGLAADETAIFGALMDRAPLTCLHRDPQIDNVLFAPAHQGGAARLLDWQFVGKGRGAYDVAYFAISSLPPDLRRSIEADLLAEYHAHLRRLGVTGYSLAQCRADYLGSAAGKLFITVAATVLLDNSSAPKRAWRRADLERLIAFCQDHAISAETLAGGGA